MRPDPRLLVPVSALPFVPEGVRVWGGVAGSAWIAIGEQRADRMLLCDTEPDGSSRDVRRFDRSPTMLLDASAPELRDGLPMRLDALPWLILVLDVAAHSASFGPFGGLLLRGEEGSTLIRVPSSLDLTNLTPDEAARAVVVAAIVARGAK